MAHQHTKGHYMGHHLSQTADPVHKQIQLQPISRNH